MRKLPACCILHDTFFIPVSKFLDKVVERECTFTQNKKLNHKKIICVRGATHERCLFSHLWTVPRNKEKL